MSALKERQKANGCWTGTELDGLQCCEGCWCAYEAGSIEPTEAEVLANVHDRRHGWIGSWMTAPLDVTKLTEADIGRTVIYRDHGRAEAGTLTSWRDGIVFARYSRGDTAAGANASDLVFGISRADSHPDAPPP